MYPNLPPEDPKANWDTPICVDKLFEEFDCNNTSNNFLVWFTDKYLNDDGIPYMCVDDVALWLEPEDEDYFFNVICDGIDYDLEDANQFETLFNRIEKHYE